MRHYVEFENVLAFQIPAGLRFSKGENLVSRQIAVRDVPAGALLLGQLKGRTLPVASARFAQCLSVTLQGCTGLEP